LLSQAINRNKRRLRQLRRSVAEIRKKVKRSGRRRIRWGKVKRELGFLRIVGFFQAVRFITYRLRGVHTIELRVSGIQSPLVCRTSGPDRWTLWHVFGRDHFDETTPQDSPGLVIDAGANVGYASVYFANKYPSSQIIAIEPDTANCKLFRKNCAGYSNIELIQGALWSSSADLIIDNPSGRSHAFRVAEIPSPTNTSIKGFTVAELLARSGKRYIDLMKLDIEGSEEQLFSSNYSDWIGHAKRMIIETHGKRRRSLVSNAAKECGFSVSRRGEYTVLEKGTSQGSNEQKKPKALPPQRASGSLKDEPAPLAVTPVATERRRTKEEWGLEVHHSIEHIHGPEEIDYEEDELVVVCIVRDGRMYVKSFVEHYFSVGVKHMVFLDNNSQDGTVEVLRHYDHVTVLRTELPYKATDVPGEEGMRRGVFFKRYLINRFGKEGRWCLCVDIDELFDYPYSDVIGLTSLLRYLNSKKYTAVVAHMLDMFSETPLSNQMDKVDESLRDSYRFYDLSNIERKNLASFGKFQDNTFDSDDIEQFSGGIRESVFGHKPRLTKAPLVFNDGKARPLAGSTHVVAGANIADFTTVLFHYKLVNGHFHAQVEQAVKEEHRIQNSAVYKKYKQTLNREPTLQLKRDTAKEMRNVNDLVEDRFLVVSDDYVSWVDTEEEKRVLKDNLQGGPHRLTRAFLNTRKQERAKTLRIQKLERRLSTLESEHQKLKLRAKSFRKRNAALNRKLQDISRSKSWRFLNTVNQRTTKILRTLKQSKN
jgi:FkbM family methyltransferase